MEVYLIAIYYFEANSSDFFLSGTCLMDSLILVLKICSPWGGCLAKPLAMLTPFQEHWAWASFKSMMY